LATQKKSTSKKSGKSSKTSKKDDFSPSEQSFGAILGGWALIGFGFILMLGCICSAYSGVKENFLGPYLGKMFPDALAFVFGRVPSLFVSSAFVLWGAALVSVSRRGRFIRYAVGLSLLSIVFSFLF
jgi:S-DNA-T family DNA segregation ATPase FtsK/SpoIIIE